MKYILVVVAIVSILFLGGCVSQSTYEGLQSDYDDVVTENKDLKSQNEQLQKELELYRETFGEVHEEGELIPFLKPIENGTEPFPTLTNNPDAVNPTWEVLSEFLKNDDTEKIRYWDKEKPMVVASAEGEVSEPCDCAGNCDYDYFTCTDFAVTLHDRAEAQGIRAAVVTISFEKAEFGHVLNAFEVVDKGLVYVDCVGNEDCNAVDKIEDINVGKYWLVCEYKYSYGKAFDEVGSSPKELNSLGSFLRGKITNVEIFW